jgi:glycosyltransferase involved in cell wall biosynthesis
MRIGILLRELDVSGGSQRLALSLAKELKKMGDEVVVYALQVDGRRCYPDLLKEISPVDLATLMPKTSPGRKNLLPLRRFLGVTPDLLLNRRIADAIPGEIDVLNVHEHFVYPAAVYWKSRTKKPIVWMMNDVPGEFFPHWDRRRPWKKFDRVVNGKEWENRIRRAMARRFDEILVLSGIEGTRLREQTGLEGRVIRCGQDSREFPFLPRHPPGPRRVRLFSNAILYPHRRLEDIVAALRILGDRGVDFEWFHAGDTERSPEYFREISRLAATAGLQDRITFLGSVSERELVRQFQRADAFLFPHTPQSWGLAVFHAMACGTPAIVSRGAGASEVLTHGKNALLVDPFSPAQIADAVEQLRENGELWKSLHVEGRRFVEENIRWDLYAKSMKTVFLRAALAFI